MDSVPAHGETIYLKSKNNISSGGDPVDILDDISEEIKQIAINGLNSIPGLPHGGIDLLVNKGENTGVIIEINSQASIRLNLFPTIGTARDIPAKLIDLYFPDTTSNSHVPLYFEFEDVWKEFKQGSKKEYEIPSIDSNNIEITRFMVSGRVQRVGYGEWIKNNADNLNIHGFVRHLRNGSTSIIASGDKDNLEQFRNIIKDESPKQFDTSNIVEKTRKTPVLIGFKLMNEELDKALEDGYHPVRLKDPKRKSKSGKKSTGNKGHDKINYEEEYRKIINSTSWKVTKPLRIIGRFRRR